MGGGGGGGAGGQDGGRGVDLELPVVVLPAWGVVFPGVADHPDPSAPQLLHKVFCPVRHCLHHKSQCELFNRVVMERSMSLLLQAQRISCQMVHRFTHVKTRLSMGLLWQRNTFRTMKYFIWVH